MKLVVVYESMFGNTRTIGEAIAEGLSTAGEVAVGTADDLTPQDVGDAALIVAGGPTQNRGMAKPEARAALARNGSSTKNGTVLPGRESLREWLERLPTGRAAAAAFDTRFDKPAWIVGSAAKEIARQLGDKGYEVVGFQSFFVRKTGGPLADGERERAVAWGRQLATQVKATVAA
jgi:Flavodoxin